MSDLECVAEFIDGTWTRDMCNCDACRYQTRQEGDEWHEGECDNCTMAPGQSGPFGICCACSIGQGAPPDECRCGPESTDA